MAATTAIEVWTGGSAGSPGAETEGSAFRLRSDDAPLTIDLTNSVAIPASGFNYSWWTHFALKFSGTFSQIDNIQFYSDGTIGFALGTAGELRRGNRDAGDHGCPKANYEPAAGTSGTTGYDLADNTNGHDYYKDQTTETADVESDVTGSRATIDSTVYTATGDSKALVLQAKVDDDATHGVASAETMTIAYDEI